MRFVVCNACGQTDTADGADKRFCGCGVQWGNGALHASATWGGASAASLDDILGTLRSIEGLLRELTVQRQPERFTESVGCYTELLDSPSRET